MSADKSVIVVEVFHSLQGEGIRAGTSNIFVRFAHCNLECDVEPGPRSPGGFSCDTYFADGVKMSGFDLLDICVKLWDSSSTKGPRAVIFTGGEPALQLTKGLVSLFKQAGAFYTAIETNGSKDVSPLGLDWITVSPKVAEHSIRQKTADEVKYVIGAGMALPKTVVKAENYLISPAFNGSEIDQRALQTCINLVKANPQWRLSLQMHKAWKIR